MNNTKHFCTKKNYRLKTGRHVVICAAQAHSNNIINSWNKSHKNDKDFVLKPIVVVCQGIHTCTYAKIADVSNNISTQMIASNVLILRKFKFHTCSGTFTIPTGSGNI